MLRSSVSYFLPKAYQYAVKLTQFKETLLTQRPFVYAPLEFVQYSLLFSASILTYSVWY